MKQRRATKALAIKLAAKFGTPLGIMPAWEVVRDYCDHATGGDFAAPSLDKLTDLTLRFIRTTHHLVQKGGAAHKPGQASATTTAPELLEALIKTRGLCRDTAKIIKAMPDYTGDSTSRADLADLAIMEALNKYINPAIAKAKGGEK